MKLFIAALVCGLATAQTASTQIKKDVTATTNVAWWIELKDMEDFVTKWTKENHQGASRTIEVVVVVDGVKQEMTFAELKRRLSPPTLPVSPYLYGCANTLIQPN